MAKLTKNQQKEYDRLTEEQNRLAEEQEKVQKSIAALKSTTYGYARVSTKGQAKEGNSLESQKESLRAAGARKIYSDAFTGTTTDRPQLELLLNKLRPGDKFVVTKLDRMARSVQQGIDLIESLIKKGVTVHILNIGILDDTPTGRLIRNILLSIAEFERDMILQRTREGKEIARTKPGFREGRPEKFTREQRELAFSLLNEGYSYRQVALMTGISRATIARIKRDYVDSSVG